MGAILGQSIPDQISTSLEVQQKRAVLRGRLLKGFAVCALLALILYAAKEWGAAAEIVSTDDAYVGAVFAQVTPQIDGTIGAVWVHDTQYVRKGDVLVTLDPSDAQLDFDGAKAAYDVAYRRVRQEVADTDAAETNVLAKESLVQQAELQLRRRTNIQQAGAASLEEISNMKTASDAAKYALSIAQHQWAAKRAMAESAVIESNPEVLAAKTVLLKSKLRLERTFIRAAVDGIVAQSQGQVGQQVAAGTQLMTIVPIRQVFVDANFKESQIMQVRVGQAVTLTSDVYGSGRIFHGSVEGVGGGTGATFAVIPPQNATGNWIKVVQRLPVRIALDPNELMDTPLRVGTTMSADIHLDHYVNTISDTKADPVRRPKPETAAPPQSHLALRTNTSVSY